MSQFKVIEPLVRKALEEHPVTRDKDNELYYWVCEYKNPMVMNMSFRDALYNGGLPSYASVTRARRKLQEKHEELRGEKYWKRYNRQKDAIYYAFDWEEE